MKKTLSSKRAKETARKYDWGNTAKEVENIYFTVSNKTKTMIKIRFAEWLSRRFLKNEEKILDAGCGHGKHMNAIRNIGKKVSGIDIDEKSIKFCKDMGFDAKKCNLEKDKIPFGNSSFDAAILLDLIEHIRSPDHMMKEIKRVLKRRGKIIVLTPDYESDPEWFWRINKDHKTPYTLEKLQNILIENKFKIITLRKFRWIPFIWKYFDFAFDFIFPKKPSYLFSVCENEK